jgi:hypothetical protein
LEVRHGYRRDRTGMIKVSRMMPGARPKGIGLQGKDCLRKYLHGYRRYLPRMESVARMLPGEQLAGCGPIREGTRVETSFVMD